MMTTSVASWRAISRPASSTSRCSSARIDVHRHGRILGRELLGGHEQEGLPGRRRQAGKVAVRRLEVRGMTVVPVSLPVPLDGVEHSQERAVEGDARLDVAGKYGGVGQQRLERHGDVGVPALLAAGNHPGETPQIRQMGRNLFRERHIRHPSSASNDRLRGLPAPSTLNAEQRLGFHRWNNCARAALSCGLARRRDTGQEGKDNGGQEWLDQIHCAHGGRAIGKAAANC